QFAAFGIEHQPVETLGKKKRISGGDFYLRDGVGVRQISWNFCVKPSLLDIKPLLIICIGVHGQIHWKLRREVAFKLDDVLSVWQKRVLRLVTSTSFPSGAVIFAHKVIPHFV